MDTDLTKTYNAVCAKNGTKFIVVESGCRVSYDESIYDLIQEDVKATAQSNLDARSEDDSVRELEDKATVTTAWNNI